MLIKRSPIGCINRKLGWRENQLTRPPSPPRSLKLPRQQNQSYLNGAKTSCMSSLRKHMTNFLPIIPMITPLNFTLTLFPKLPKSTPSTQQRWKLVKTSSRTIFEPDRSYHQSPPQPSPFFFVPKKDGTLQSCQDYCYLNFHTLQNAYPHPFIPELIDDMKKSTLFTKFNICWGYNNICIWEEDQWKATFITPIGLFKPTVMFFRFCNALPTFQAFINHIFTDMLREKWLKIYMDDLEIHTKNDIALHHEHTQWVLQCLQEHGLLIKLSKYVFDAPRMEFLGMIIRQGEIKMDEKKLEAIKEWKPPTSVKVIWLFTGFTNFYRKFI